MLCICLHMVSGDSPVFYCMYMLAPMKRCVMDTLHVYAPCVCVCERARVCVCVARARALVCVCERENKRHTR